ncbi:MAG: hypothetical protein R3F61_21775 [Myxococcota bacterium]
MLATLDASFVVQWVNIRKEPIPDFPFLDDILLGAQIDADRRVRDPQSLGFFLRELVIDPRDERLLNPQAESSWASVETFASDGNFAYAQVHPDAVMEVLETSLEAYSEL